MNLLEKSYLRLFSAALWYMMTKFMSVEPQSRISLLVRSLGQTILGVWCFLFTCVFLACVRCGSWKGKDNSWTTGLSWALRPHFDCSWHVSPWANHLAFCSLFPLCFLSSDVLFVVLVFGCFKCNYVMKSVSKCCCAPLSWWHPGQISSFNYKKNAQMCSSGISQTLYAPGSTRCYKCAAINEDFLQFNHSVDDALGEVEPLPSWFDGVRMGWLYLFMPLQRTKLCSSYSK